MVFYAGVYTLIAYFGERVMTCNGKYMYMKSGDLTKTFQRQIEGLLPHSSDTR